MRERIALIFFKVLPTFIIQDHEFLGKLITEINFFKGGSITMIVYKHFGCLRFLSNFLFQRRFCYVSLPPASTSAGIPDLMNANRTVQAGDGAQLVILA